MDWLVIKLRKDCVQDITYIPLLVSPNPHKQYIAHPCIRREFFSLGKSNKSLETLGCSPS